MFISKNIKKTAIVSLVVGFVAVPLAAYAQTDDTIITANISSTISIETSEEVDISVMPATGGAQSSEYDTITVSTNSSSGYTLTLEDVDSDTDLVGVGNDDEIAAHSGTLGTPTELDNNSWGYAVAGLDDFSPSYSTFTNAPSHASLWAGVPVAGDADVLKETEEPADGDTTTVWYSVKVDTSKPDGAYVDTVRYTATTN